MSENKAEDRTFYFLLFIFCFSVFLCPIESGICMADGQQEQPKIPGVLTDIWDPNKYISIDEVRPGMEAYCLTCYKDTDIEKFGLEVISVVRNISPGRNAILVKGTDERFIQTGPVGGCSGSPVYINGRLAGALAFAWYLSKDPLYGATPIEEMLQVGRFNSTEQDAASSGYVFDFSRPLDLAEIDRQITSPQFLKENRLTGINPLPCLLITPELSAEFSEQLATFFEPLGLMVVSGFSGGGLPSSANESEGQTTNAQDICLEPGAVLTVPLVSGDITMFVLGTVTEVVNGRVYGFGHSFLGRGPVNLPMATGQVHTVVSSLSRSFKLGSTLDIVGTLTTDESAAVFGQIGEEPKTIPLTITVDRYNDSQKRVYNCRVATDLQLTPMVMAAAVNSAVSYLGALPLDHTIEFKAAINTDKTEPVTFENISTGGGINDMLMASRTLLAILMNNPFRKINIESLDFEIRILPKNIISQIWSVDLSDSKVKAGETIEIAVVVESFLAGKKQYKFSLTIPEDLPPGVYELTVCGSQDYAQFLQKAAPYKFLALNLPSLIEAINNSLQIRQDRLYCLLTLPPSGLALERAELPDLPATKALVLQSEKRTLRTQPYRPWLEESIETGTIIVDNKVVRLMVEE